MSFYAWYPAITRHEFGAGHAYYIATQLDGEPLGQLIAALAEEAGVKPTLAAQPGIEVIERQNQQGVYLFVLNRLAMPQTIQLPEPMRDLLADGPASARIQLSPKGMAILVAEHQT